MGVSDDEQEQEFSDGAVPRTRQATEKWRNLASYWLLGLCNNYAYVIMLSAAHDILSHDYSGNSTEPVPTPTTNNTRDCNPVSTGAILLADVIPSLIMKLTMPFLLTHIRLRVIIVILASSASFIIVAISTAEWQAFVGVIFAALSGGVGEVTFLQYSAHYHKNVVSTWSSGTGGSGLFGALSYAALTTAGVTPRQTLLIMLIIPVLMSLTFFCFLEHGRKRNSSERDESPLLSRREGGEGSPERQGIDRKELGMPLSMSAKLRVLPKIAKYLIPLALVYVSEYFINQGLFELIFFQNVWLDHHSQYRWYQVIYQLGVFISRSSVNMVKINAIWMLAVLQFVNVILLTCEAVYLYVPSIWIVFGLIMWEGLLAGAAYVNTFYRVANESLPEEKAFAMGMTSLAGSIGVSTAGLLAVPFHRYLCSLPLSEAL